jgi:CelD/BcsL family acetyltransferase involved in cellulose biosynthesis
VSSARRIGEWATDIDELRATWQSLGELAGNPFLTWEWGSAWWRHFGKPDALRAQVIPAPSGEPAALLPLYATRFRRLPALRFVGHGPGDQLGPVCAPAERGIAAEAMRGLLRNPPSRTWLLVAEGLPADEGWEDALPGAAVLDRSPNPVLSADGRSWEEFLASRSRNFRQQVKSRERRLGERHELSYRLADEASFEADFDTLVRLHELRWQGTTSVFAGGQATFQREAARAMLERGRLRLWVLELGDEPAAAWLGFRMGGAEWYYQSGRDPRLDDVRPGFVLLCHTIRSALEDGMREYRFLLGGEAYKDRFANADPGLVTLAAPSSPLGRTALATRRIVHALPRPRR